MLKNTLIAMLVFCGSMTFGLQAEESTPVEQPAVEQNAPAFQVPEEFSVKERWFSWSTSFDVETRTQKFGTIHRRIFSLTTQYDFYDAYDKLQANARMRFFSFGAVFDVTDANKQSLGTVRQHIFTFFPTFEIMSPEDHTQAIAKLNFWGTKYTVRDPVTHEVIAELSRPFFSFRDNWKVSIINHELFVKSKIDPRLFVVVMTFQTDRDHWIAQRNAQNNNNNGDRDKINKNMMMKVNLLTGDEPKKFDFSGLRSELEALRESMEKVEPTEEDIAFVEDFVEEYLAVQGGEADAAEGTENAVVQDEQERIYQGLTQLIPLLSQDEMTAVQKSALYFMIDSQIKKSGA